MTDCIASPQAPTAECGTCRFAELAKKFKLMEKRGVLAP